MIQKLWDQSLRDKRMKLVLVGSLMSTMGKLISYTGPLYGRKTGSWKLSSLSFGAFLEYLSKIGVSLSPRQALDYWAILGGLPYYWSFFSFRDLLKEVKERILSKGAPLHEEGLFLLREELREPREYLSILQVLAFGARPIGKIASELGEPSQKLSKYLKVLEDLELIKVEHPLSLRNRRKKRGLYSLNHNLLRFWLRYLYPNTLYAEMGEEDRILDKVRSSWTEFLGEVYEKLALQVLKDKVSKSSEVRAWGRWWDRDSEIDGVVIAGQEVHVCEAKLRWEPSLEKLKRAAHRLLSSLKEEGFTPKRLHLWVFYAERYFWGREMEVIEL